LAIPERAERTSSAEVEMKLRWCEQTLRRPDRHVLVGVELIVRSVVRVGRDFQY
jgi:hypothetical protein